jgi:acetolactate synthase-1/2/3 large subunit
MIKVSDYIIKFFEEKGVDTAFCITGGAAAHLLESTRTSNLDVVHNYNEQACAMAADAYARVAKKPAMVLVTNGPGSSNILTGVLGAWQDSLPMIIVTGQVPRHQTMSAERLKLRQLGLQEADIMSMAEHCTNYAVQLHDVNNIKYELGLAWHLATTGRMGPVWLDVPIDVQAELIDPDTQLSYTPDIVTVNKIDDAIFAAIEKAQRPLIIAGNGIHLANAESEFLTVANKLKIPVLCTWSATDLFDFNDPLYIGNFGLLGERAANFAVQRADLLIILGSRLSIPITGYTSKDFAPNAVKIMVDVDVNEIRKHTLDIDHAYIGDLADFLTEFDARCPTVNVSKWHQRLLDWKQRYQVFNEDHMRETGFVNSFDFMRLLSDCLQSNDIVVTDMGTSFTCTMQSLRNTGKNRLFTSSALCSMGFGLPGAIGAYMANRSSRIICISGDGGIQMNIQELQTIAQYNIPVKSIILNNDGYLAISLMQDNLFNKNHFGADSASGVGSPDFIKLADAYGIPGHRLTTTADVEQQLSTLLAQAGPSVIEINMVRNQLLIPRVQSRKDSEGQIVSGSLDMMFPFLDDDEYTNLLKGEDDESI